MAKQTRVQPPLPPVNEPPTPSTPTPTSTTIAKGTRVYVSTQGDFWDVIAIRVYGRRRGNEHLMYRLLEENYPLREVVQFPAGVAVIVPEVDVATEIPLVPWKSAASLPTS